MFHRLKNDQIGRSAVDNLLIITGITVMACILGKALQEKLPDTIDNIFRSLPNHVLEQAQNNQ